MRILVVSEGVHELRPDPAESALMILCARLLGTDTEFEREKVSDDRVKRHFLRGTGDRYTKRALGWVGYAERSGFDAVVIVIDEDGLSERVDQFDAAQENTQLGMPRALGVAIRRFDAWMLADETALTRVLGYNVNRQPKPESITDPKSVCTSLLSDSKRSLRPRDMYADVARELNIETLEGRCPKGFRPFADRVRGLRSPDHARH